MESIILERCEICFEYVILSRAVLSRPFECPKCRAKKSRNKDKPEVYRDYLEDLRQSDPGPIPDELKNLPLSFLEEQLISLVQVNQYIYIRKTGAIATKGK